MKLMLYTLNRVKISGGILINLEKAISAVEKETAVSSEDWISHYQKLLYDSQEPHTTFDFSNENLDLENKNSPNNDNDNLLRSTKSMNKYQNSS